MEKEVLNSMLALSNDPDFQKKIINIIKTSGVKAAEQFLYWSAVFKNLEKLCK